MKRSKHVAHHIVFENDTPTEQIIRTLQFNSQILTNKFKKELILIVQDAQDDERAYKN